MERGLVLFGIVALIVGLGAGYLIYAFPEGLNPSWPIWMAMLAPGAFILAGMHMVAVGLGRPALAQVSMRALALCLLVIVNWAAFFSTQIQCVETVSFLGMAIFSRYPSAAECQFGLRMLVIFIDALILLPTVWFAWRKWQERKNSRLPRAR